MALRSGGNPAVRNLIREGKSFQIINQIQTGAKFGMILLIRACAIGTERIAGGFGRDADTLRNAVGPGDRFLVRLHTRLGG